MALMQRLDRLARNLTPLFLTLLLVLFSALPFYIPYFGQVSPSVALMATFYWAVYRPDLFPVSAVFVIGIWQDILTGMPVGVSAVILLLVHWTLLAQHRFFRNASFTVVWWAFILMAISASLLEWLIISALHATIVNPLPVFFQAAFTIFLFPFVNWLLARIQQAILRPE